MKIPARIGSNIILLILFTFLLMSCPSGLHAPQEIRVQVTFDAQGGSVPVPAATMVTNGEAYGELATTARIGHAFGGWWTLPGGEGAHITSATELSVAENHTLHAKWIENGYTISFDANTGTGVMADQVVAFGGTIPLRANGFGNAGYSFCGWALSPGGALSHADRSEITMGASDLTLYARWDPIRVTGMSIPEGSQTVVTGGTAALSAAIAPSEALNRRVAWTSGNTSVATVDENGLVSVNAGASAGDTADISAATDDGNFIDEVTITVRFHELGETGPAGGLVFYNKGSYSDGWRYLEAAPFGWYDTDSDGNHGEDEDPSSQWGAFRYVISPPAWGTGIGSGEANTANIVSFHDSLVDYYAFSDLYLPGDGTVAAKICADHAVTTGGMLYDDWFLPSRDELYWMYKNLRLAGMGGFTVDEYYWSSSESNDEDAVRHHFSESIWSNYYKYSSYRVRAVRAF